MPPLRVAEMEDATRTSARPGARSSCRAMTMDWPVCAASPDEILRHGRRALGHRAAEHQARGEWQQAQHQGQPATGAPSRLRARARRRRWLWCRRTRPALPRRGARAMAVMTEPPWREAAGKGNATDVPVAAVTPAWRDLVGRYRPPLTAGLSGDNRRPMPPLLPAGLLLLAVVAAAGGLLAIRALRRRAGHRAAPGRRPPGAPVRALLDEGAARPPGPHRRPHPLPGPHRERPRRAAGRAPPGRAGAAGRRRLAVDRADPRVARLRAVGPRRLAAGGPVAGGRAAGRHPARLARQQHGAGGSAPHLAAVERLGGGPMPARSITRTVSVVDRLLLLASVVRDEAGALWLRPPPGGYVISHPGAGRRHAPAGRAASARAAGRLRPAGRSACCSALAGGDPVRHRRLARTSVRGRSGTNGAYGAQPCHFYHPFTGSYQNLHSLNWGAKHRCPRHRATGGTISTG